MLHSYSVVTTKNNSDGVVRAGSYTQAPQYGHGYSVITQAPVGTKASRTEMSGIIAYFGPSALGIPDASPF